MTDKPKADVHIASAAPGVLEGRGRKAKSALYETILFTAGEPAQNILPASDTRKVAFVIPVDQAVVIGSSKSDVAAGVGTLIPQSVAWPIEDDNPVFAAPTPALTAGSTARLSVSHTYEEGETDG